MKIGFFGNTANIPLLIAQVMQRMGHTVILVVNRKDLLYRPESRFPEYARGYPEWILDGSRFDEQDYMFLDPKITPVLDVLSGCDALFLNDLGPSFLPLFQRPAISFLTGSDLTHYADRRLIDIRTGHWSENYQKTTEAGYLKRQIMDFIQRQRDGIRSSVAVRFFPRGVDLHGDALLAELGVPESKRFFQTTTEVEGIIPTPQPNNDPIRVYCPVRITWKLPIDPGRSTLDYKGSDIMVRGLGLFYRKTGIRLDIVLMRKGLHIPELEEIILEEGIADQVKWLDEMSLTAYREEIAKSDIILEQFGESFIGGVGWDAMASARPVIGNTRPEIIGETMPICQAKTPEEICMQLQRLVSDPGLRARVGEAGRNYVEKNIDIELFARKCLAYLEPAISNREGSEPSDLSSFLQKRQQQYSMMENLSVNYDASRLIPLKRRFIKGTGFAWQAPLQEYATCADDMDDPYRSKLLLLEDSRPLWFRHSAHDEIRDIGFGRYSHWQDGLIFSTSDNSDPNTNGRSYQITFTSAGEDRINN